MSGLVFQYSLIETLERYRLGTPIELGEKIAFGFRLLALQGFPPKEIWLANPRLIFEGDKAILTIEPLAKIVGVE